MMRPGVNNRKHINHKMESRKTQENHVLEMMRPNENWSTQDEINKFFMHLIAFVYEPKASEKTKARSKEIIDGAHMGLYTARDMENMLIDLYTEEFGNLTI